jgi:hypothetical protein
MDAGVSLVGFQTGEASTNKINNGSMIPRSSARGDSMPELGSFAPDIMVKYVKSMITQNSDDCAFNGIEIRNIN